MIINTYNIHYLSNSINTDVLFKEAIFIDIETTGLSRTYSDIISITALLYEGESFNLHQMFCEYKIDEPQVLLYLKDLMKNKKYIITYNGNSFDLPFLEYKINKYNLNFNLIAYLKLDLYFLVRQQKNKFNTIDLKLKTIEEFFKINRSDTLGGKDIITLYEAYRIEPRKEFSSLILQHNYEDVYNLPMLLESITGLYDDVFYFNDMIVFITNNNFIIKKNSLICIYQLFTNRKTDYIHNSINFNINMDIRKSKIEINIPLEFYEDEKVKEFYYIDNNNYNIKSYSIIEGIKSNLLPIKFNEITFYKNVNSVVKHILYSIFN